MHLSADMFRSVVRQLKSENAGSESRSNARLGVSQYVTILPHLHTGLGPPQRVRCRDISAGGIAILHHLPGRVGQQFVLELGREETEPVRLLCKVVRAQKVAKDLFLQGAEFVQELTRGSTRPVSTVAAA